MDPGAAAVWASAVAGFSSALGAALGSAFAGRTALVTIRETERSDRRQRRHAGTQERFRHFQDNVNTAVHALHDVVHALTDGVQAPDLPARKAIDAAKLSYQADVWSSCPVQLVHAGGAVCERLEVVHAAVQALMRCPEDAKDENSRTWQRWGRSLAEFEFAYQNASAALYGVLSE
ncbi:hypothetical protein [Streptomyces sp. NPDC006552]|uniref:hypothetical protein n=1 Tax=Streptomyces sp. NPDC006552 TaxID=3157179 RepID=UPI0033A8B58F